MYSYKNGKEFKTNFSTDKIKDYNNFFIDPVTNKNFIYKNPKILRECNCTHGDLIFVKDSLDVIHSQDYEMPVLFSRLDLHLQRQGEVIDAVNILYSHEGSFATTEKYFFINADTIYMKTFLIDEVKIELKKEEKWLITPAGFRILN